uniref:Uncharacterized protein n=1 Tax=Ditylenchus dipsaci TaxID=166011 RepID=A0A915EK51_9BILA
MEIDYLVQKDGVTIYSPRLKTEKFVEFDLKEEINDKCFFKIQTKGRLFKVPFKRLAAPYAMISGKQKIKEEKRELTDLEGGISAPAKEEPSGKDSTVGKTKKKKNIEIQQ